MIELVKFIFDGGTEIYARITGDIDYDEIEDAISSYLDSVDYDTELQLVEDVLDSFQWDYTILRGDISKFALSHVFLI